MSEWVDVPVAEIQPGDEAKVDGYGKLSDSAYSFHGIEFYPVMRVDEPDLVVDWMQGSAGPARLVRVRRSSIVAVRRRKPEPEPKPGDWRCVQWIHQMSIGLHSCDKQHGCRVYRASGGWSPDTRTGQPWMMRGGDPVEIVLLADVGDLSAAFAKADLAVNTRFQRDGESWADYYKRIGIGARPVDRRKQ